MAKKNTFQKNISNTFQTKIFNTNALTAAEMSYKQYFKYINCFKSINISISNIQAQNLKNSYQVRTGGGYSIDYNNALRIS